MQIYIQVYYRILMQENEGVRTKKLDFHGLRKELDYYVLSARHLITPVTGNHELEFYAEGKNQ